MQTPSYIASVQKDKKELKKVAVVPSHHKIPKQMGVKNKSLVEQ